MNRSLYTKLVIIILIIIISLMAVVGVFLTRGVRSFYLNEFYNQMQEVFSSRQLADDLRVAANSENAAAHMADIIRGYSGKLGIDSGTRNYYILDGGSGAYLTGSAAEGNGLEITPNIVTAIGGKEGYVSDPGAAYMDVALPVSGESGSYIIYIMDNKETAQSLNDQLFRIIIQALVVGLIISVLLSLLLAKTMIAPIQDLTMAAKKVAGGDFSEKLENHSKDEIGILTQTFNDMAGRLEDTLDDLTKSEQMRREFVANVSHELRTPITSIRSYAETLGEDTEIPDVTRQKFLEVILNESDRMAKIVQDLLTLSRFDAGSISFVFERFSFEKSVRDVYNATVMEAQSHKHDFVLEFRTPIPDILGDRARIEQVLLNMVSNAVKYTKDGGKMRMTAGAKNGEVWCSVRDNGIGIPKEDVTKVFDRFYRVDKARSRESGGTGLGLSIAKEIVARHGGRMELESREGKGTNITVWLPSEGPEDVCRP
ncbi:MAG TPA: diguanylate cyclase [Clostridiales bacterium]|nr:diguanylate cyclase [Clostridiales bacterium]